MSTYVVNIIYDLIALLLFEGHIFKLDMSFLKFDYQADKNRFIHLK